MAACSARRWLARNAARVKLVHSNRLAAASACTSLVACLPALEDVTLRLAPCMFSEDLGSLLELLAWCPRLRALDLLIEDELDEAWEADMYEYEDYVKRGLQRFFPGATAFAQLHSLTKLALCFDEDAAHPLARRVLHDIVTALVPLTGLTELAVLFPMKAARRPAVVPAALAQLTGLRSLELSGLIHTVLEAGCLDLPNLASLGFRDCHFQRPEVLPGVSAFALPSLARIKLTECRGGSDALVSYELERLPRLQRMVFATGELCRDGASL